MDGEGVSAGLKRVRRGARRKPVTSPDPIEIAMEAEASGAAPGGEVAGLLADQGRTGEVVASQIQDRLSAMQQTTSGSSRPTETYANDWGRDIKVAIPE